ncbi:HGGxSTG domain-containing protein [Photobacterium sp. TY1-4]|uniref:HGGxSTG domain-containing protein n=1 Tax=Photobacterium sp. TY1-4 TaxID=2899122 RepID=UPI0021C0B379|nr:HGGxSTG domain-containing protein [Photobacterium sp. TY1-4]UXI01127.1 hypothetical protein NH461_15390 [Photobacterium sp. TY1-4]
MTRFKLTSLPLCGAKTRSGTPCKRRGNKRNGRCKLHGGRSSGAQTEQGKMTSRVNALKIFPGWHFGEPVAQEYLIRATNCYHKLSEAMNTKPIDWQHVFSIIEQDRIPLEMLKYHIGECTSAADFIMIQTALDRYYQEYNHQHLSFTVYAPMVMPQAYFRDLSSPQREYLLQWLHKHSIFNKIALATK